MTTVFSDCILNKVYTSSLNDNFPAPRGVCWNSTDKHLFFGGSNYVEDFPICYRDSARQGTRFQTLTSGRTKTRLVRPSIGSACIEHQDYVYIFGGRQWMPRVSLLQTTL